MVPLSRSLESSDWCRSYAWRGKFTLYYDVLRCASHSPFQTFSWIPADVAAQALVDLRLCTRQVAHLLHSNPVSSITITKAVSTLLQLPIMPYKTWLQKLKQSTVPVSENPALRLLGFFESHGTEFKPEHPAISVANALEASKSMEGLKDWSLREEDVAMWIKYWIDVGFLHSLSGQLEKVARQTDVS